MLTSQNRKTAKPSQTLGYGATWGTRLLLAATLVGGVTLLQLLPQGEEKLGAQRQASPAAVAAVRENPRESRSVRETERSRSLWSRLTSLLPSSAQPQGSKASNSSSAIAASQTQSELREIANEAAERSEEKVKDPIQAKIAPDLNCATPTTQADVIVQFNQPVTDSIVSGVRSEGSLEKSKLKLIGAVRFQMPCGSVSTVAANPAVAYITPNRTMRATSLSDYASETEAVMAPLAWQSGWTGAGIGVAVIDSGIRLQGDLKVSGSDASRVVHSEAFREDSSTTDDQFGHGTHVAGIIGGNGKDSESLLYFKNYRGIAPNANLINLAVLGANGSGRDSDVILAIDRAIELKQQFNIRVINLSLGRQVFESYTQDPICVAVQRAWEAGIVVVAAAGNEGRNHSYGTHGYGTIASPGNSPYVITVGAMRTRKTDSRTDDRVASYSSKGPTRIDLVVKPDIVAPGDAVVSLAATGSTLYNSRISRRVGDTYFKMSGTSMAAPMVSGAVALMMEKDPNLTPDQVKARLMKTAYKAFPTRHTYLDMLSGQYFDSQYDIFTVGAGYLDVPAALASSELPSMPTLSPKIQYNSETDRTSILHAEGVLWGSAVLWGTGVVWGNGVIWGEAIQWDGGEREISGSAVIWGTGVIWGETSSLTRGVIWGAGVIWGESTQAAGVALSSELSDEDGTIID